jgi:hypothetical protein
VNTTPPNRSDGVAWQLQIFEGSEGRVSVCALEEGVRTLGSSTACDIVLPGGDVAERAMVLEIGRWLVTVRPEAAVELRLNGERVDARRRVVMLGDVLELGGLTLRLLRSRPTTSSRAGGGLRRRASAAIAMTCLAAGTVVLLGSSGFTLGRPTAPVASDAELPALREFPEVRWERQPPGAVVVGFVPSAADRQRLADVVRRRDPAAAIQVQVVEELTRRAREFIADPTLSVAYAGHGEWAVSGTTDDEAVKRRLERLARDLKPLATVTDRVSLERLALKGAVATSGTGGPPSNAGTSADHEWVALYSDGSGTRYWLGPDGSRHFVSMVATASGPAPIPPERHGETPSRPADALRVSAEEQRLRDDDRRRILEQELKKESSALADASAQGASDAAARHAADVEALKRELARLK